MTDRFQSIRDALAGGCTMTDQKINDGGPAFPWNEKDSDGSHYHGNPGMSLRDWFAGQVLTGFVTGSWQDPFQADSREALEEAIKGIAWSCYLVADAMLAVREEGRS